MQLLSLQKTMIYDLIVKKGFSPANSIGHLIFFFFGVITNIIIALFITPDNAEHIWEAVKQMFTGFLLK